MGADPLKVLVKTALSPYSGYGADGIGIALALLQAGVDVYLDPSHIAPPLPPTIAALLTKRLEAPFDVLIHHADPMQLGITPEARRSAKVTVGWTMWEYSSVDNMRGRSTLRRRLRDFDLVLGYDTVTQEALAPHIGTGSESAVLQGGYWPQDWPFQGRDWHSDRFGFCMVGQLSQRKDPFVAIQAFHALKQRHSEEFDGAELHLKTNSLGLHPSMEKWIPKLRVHYSVWRDDVMREFYGAQHCLLAPSRGEGKNLPALEMLSTGGVVIATGWGGHQQWLSPAFAHVLDYTLHPVSAEFPNCRNARATQAHLEELMLRVYRNRAESAAMGQRGSVLIPQMCAWPSVIARLFDRLAQHGVRVPALAPPMPEVARA
jgi:glycosyltransferase involved in cell wall biosynthesis